MADGKITRPEIIEDAALTFGVELEKQYDKATKAAIRFGETAKKFSTITTDKEFNKLKKEQSALIIQSTKVQQQLEKLKQTQIATNTKLQTQAQAANKTSVSQIKLEEEKRKQKEATLRSTEKSAEAEQKAIRSINQTKKSEIQLSAAQRREKEALAKSAEKNANAVKRENREYVQLTTKLRTVRERVEDLNAKKILGNKLSDNEQKELRESQKEYDQLETKIRKVDERNNKFQRAVGKYPKILGGAIGSLKKFALALGVVTGLRALVNVLGKSLEIFSRFEKESSKLEAVLGATRKEMIALRIQAKELGATTAFTSNQVIQLETSFAKLGFPTDDILKMTKATLAAAAAMGSDLGETAKLTGSTLKAFGLEADQASRVTDVLAKSTSISALDFEKLSSSLSTISPVAKSFGFSLEATVSLLGELSNAGFDASTAATATRKILLNLADSNGKLAKSLKEPVTDLPSLVSGLKQLKDEGVDLGEALELTDVRSVAAFSTFLEGADSLSSLNDSLENAAGSAERMADIQLDNLAGDVTILNSAWEGFILSVTTGSSLFSKTVRGFVKGFTSILNALNKALQPQRDFSDGLRDEVKQLQTTSRQLNARLKVLRNTNVSEGQRPKLIKKVNEEFSDFLPKAITLKDTEQQLVDIQKQSNELLVQRIIIKTREAEITEIANKLAEQQIKLAVFEENVVAQRIKLEELRGKKGEQRSRAVISRNLAFASKNREIIEGNIADLDKQLNKEDDLTQKILERLNIVSKPPPSTTTTTTGGGGGGDTDAQEKAIFELEKFKRQQSIRGLDERIKDENEDLEERLSLIAKKVEKEISLQAFVRDETIRLKSLTASETILIEEQTQERINQIAADSIKESFELRIQSLRKFQDEQNKLESEQILTIREEAGSDPEKIKEAEEEIKQIKIDNAKETFEAQIKFLQDLLIQEELTAEQRGVVEDELTQLKLKNLDLLSAKTEDQQKAIRDSFLVTADVIADSLNITSNNIVNVFDGLTSKLEEGESKFERFAEVAAASLSLIGEISNNIFENNIETIDQEIQANEDKYTKQLELAEGNEVQTELLENEREQKRQELEKKKKSEQTKQAKFNKAASAVAVTINTAVAVSKVLAQTGVLAPATIPIIIALGAAQLAAVLAAPIPKFKDGVQGFTGGAAILGDGGVPEVVTDSNKNVLGITPAKDTLYNLPKGANVYSSVGDFSKKEGLMDNVVRSSILTSVHGDMTGMSVSDLGRTFDRNFDHLEKNIQKGIDQGFKKVNFSIKNNITVDNSYSEYIKSGLS